MPAFKGLLERLKDGETVICAEGYVFEFERRGYMKAGPFVPEVVVKHPHLVKALHEEFVHCGSDVVEAFTYYGHRQKLKLISFDDETERLNRKALKIAREVARSTNSLMAGNICNTTIYEPGNSLSIEQCQAIFKEQVQWATEEGADFIIAETFGDFGEAKLALESIKEVNPNMPSVITMTSSGDTTFDDVPLLSALKTLQDLGADVVGLNCLMGPDTMVPLMKEMRKELKCPLACLPVAYRTTEKDGRTMLALKDEITGQCAFPNNLDPWLVSNSAIEKMTKELMEIGVQYMGICCGNRAHYIRTMAETLGRTPPASKYSMDMSRHLSQIQGKEYKHANKSLQKILSS